MRELADCIPPDAMLAVKNTGSDYYLSQPITDVITSGIGQDQPLMVLFDTYREYDGWSRLFCLMDRWGERVRICRKNGRQRDQCLGLMVQRLQPSGLGAGIPHR